MNEFLSAFKNLSGQSEILFHEESLITSDTLML